MYKHGLTMIEILAVMLIISVVTSVALPAIDNFRSSDRCKAEASKFVDSIRQAKYMALQESTLNRIVFSDDSYKVQSYEFKENQFVSYDQTISVYGNSETVSSDPYGEWLNIADSEEIDFDPAVEVNKDDSFPKVIYFKPDGYLYNKEKNVISEHLVTFKYGSAKIEVRVNSLGVISSEEFPEETTEETLEETEGGEPISINKKRWKFLKKRIIILKVSDGKLIRYIYKKDDNGKIVCSIDESKTKNLDVVSKDDFSLKPPKNSLDGK